MIICFLEVGFSRRRRISVRNLPGNFRRVPITARRLEERFGALIDQKLLSMVQIGRLFYLRTFHAEVPPGLHLRQAGQGVTGAGTEALVWFVQPEAPRRPRARDQQALAWKIAFQSLV
jgi:hypothetical protein